MKLCKNVKKPSERLTELVDDITPGPQEKVKMHQVKISFFFSFHRRKISA